MFDDLRLPKLCLNFGRKMSMTYWEKAVKQYGLRPCKCDHFGDSPQIRLIGCDLNAGKENTGKTIRLH